MMERDSEADQLAYAQALSTGATSAATSGRRCGTPARSPRWACPTSGPNGARSPPCPAVSRSGRARSAAARPEEVLLLDEPDNYLDVPGKRWLEDALIASPKTVLFISHDRELLARVATRIATLEPGAAGNAIWVHPGRFATYATRPGSTATTGSRSCAPVGRGARQAQGARASCIAEGGLQLRHGGPLQAAETRLRKFEEAGPPEAVPVPRTVRMRLTGGRTAKRAVDRLRAGLELTGLMRRSTPRSGSASASACSGSNGSGKSHFLRLLACGGSDPDVEHQPVGDVRPEPVRHTGAGAVGRPGAAGVVRPDP
jgi:ATPase subunit of ABC transporter with duplicated ATPase domains